MALVCAECGETIPEKSRRRVTCSPKCRKRRERRVNREKRQLRGQSRVEREVISSAALKDAVSKELAPVVREALTEEVLTAAKGLIRLTPKAIERLNQDLDHPDATIRQRAYQTVIKIVGHPALMPERATEDKSLTVHFNLPRPEANGAVEVVETKTCDFCGTAKKAEEFIGDSERCRECYDSTQKEAQRILES